MKQVKLPQGFKEMLKPFKGLLPDDALVAAYAYLATCGVEIGIHSADKNQGIKADFGKSNDYSKKYGLSDFNAHKLTKERNGQYAIYLTNDKESRLRLAFKRGGRDEKGREVIEIVDITDHYREEGNKFRSDIESDVWDFSKIFSNRGINLDEIGIKGDWD